MARFDQAKGSARPASPNGHCRLARRKLGLSEDFSGLKIWRPGRKHRILVATVAALIVSGIWVSAVGYRNATAAPVVRRLTIHLPTYPQGTEPVRIALFSDLHVHGPDMPPIRLESIVRQINALQPDIDVVAGDFTGENWIGRRYGFAEAVAPLRKLKSRFGVYAVLGNNDFQPKRFTRALNGVGVHVLSNEATEVGPLAIGGIDGRLAHSQPALDEARSRTYADLQRLPGIKVLIAHRPDEFVAAPPFVTLVLAGHTHCGQIVLPLVGPLSTGSDYGRKYACGFFRDGSKMLVVTAGLGTSHLPLRIGAPSDIWLISIQGPGRASPDRSK